MNKTAVSSYGPREILGRGRRLVPAPLNGTRSCFGLFSPVALLLENFPFQPTSGFQLARLVLGVR
jgi:hypothetical protein